MKQTQKEWRKAKRAARKALSAAEKESHSQAIAASVLASKAYQQAENIGAYLCLPEEVDVEHIIRVAWADGKSVYLPVVVARGEKLKFAPYRPDAPLAHDILAIAIPDVSADEYVDAQQLDIVVTPLVAFDQHCNRIGMGGGFYDRTFAFKKTGKATPTLIGVAFEIQKMDESIEAHDWDVCPDSIVTELQNYGIDA